MALRTKLRSDALDPEVATQPCFWEVKQFTQELSVSCSTTQLPGSVAYLQGFQGEASGRRTAARHLGQRLPDAVGDARQCGLDAGRAAHL